MSSVLWGILPTQKFLIVMVVKMLRGWQRGIQSTVLLCSYLLSCCSFWKQNGQTCWSPSSCSTVVLNGVLTTKPLWLDLQWPDWKKASLCWEIPCLQKYWRKMNVCSQMYQNVLEGPRFTVNDRWSSQHICDGHNKYAGIIVAKTTAFLLPLTCMHDNKPDSTRDKLLF